ncbi:MAG: NADPH-dependent F420 reductase [Armatimonadota bacterium]|nr:NADPH-dependent F420 reductase [Armatimonadota bacterium]MDR7427920.1 NADPH-dependent F420 reductase [Armatimonadota bacterium]MDR7464189.1 NADPH-dependent F420 reductase [Armatimonadota bacterium]MDR7470588.1 NADPH-dependent F420 reductase [Armatimonadota bacterium]MDR7475702.1 NADPH-dependent F420 reductase [Armatimonadota bacterium]
MSAVAIIGGTGHLGLGLAARWAQAGRRVIIGSRQAAKALAAAQEALALTGESTDGAISGALNREAAAAAEVVVLTIPFAAQAAILSEVRPVVAGKVVVDTTVPLRQYAPPLLEEIPAGSAAAQAQALLPEARVVAALHTVSQAVVRRVGQPLEGDVLICGDDDEAKAVVAALVADLGARALDAGGLTQAATLERLAALVIGLNQRYRRRAVGVRFTGI